MAQYMSRGWCLCLNAPVADDDETALNFLQAWANSWINMDECSYICMKAEKAGRAHLHVYVQFEHKWNMRDVLELFENKTCGVHIEKQLGSATDARKYVMCNNCREIPKYSSHPKECTCKDPWLSLPVEHGEFDETCETRLIPKVINVQPKKAKLGNPWDDPETKQKMLDEFHEFMERNPITWEDVYP